MSDFFIWFSIAVLVLWGIFITYSVKTGIDIRSFSKKEKTNLSLILLMSVFASIWFVFFEDQEMIFDCRRDTQKCEYYHSTLYDKQVRLARSYDLSDVKDATVSSYSTRSGKYYKIGFETPTGRFEIPDRFYCNIEIDRHLSEIRSFLKGERPGYIYKKPYDPASEYDFIILIALVSLAMAAVAGIGIIFSRDRKRP